MKKYICLLICMTIIFTLLAGCSSLDNSISAAGTEKALAETAASRPENTADWKPTPYEVVNNFQGVTMNVKKGTATSTQLTVAFKNNSSSQCILAAELTISL